MPPLSSAYYPAVIGSLSCSAKLSLHDTDSKEPPTLGFISNLSAMGFREEDNFFAQQATISSCRTFPGKRPRQALLLDNQRSKSRIEKMGEEGSSSHGDGKIEGHWWWALASTTQAVTSVVAYRRGRRTESLLMPVKAFFIASLIVGSGATAIAGLLSASGIHKVDDLKNLGKNIRSGLGVRPREATSESN